MATTDQRDGIVRDEKTGEYYIPASQRPDGTWRKPRKVKDGYVPQEEVPVYENKGVHWMKSKPSLPPGMNFVETPNQQSKGHEDSTAGMSKAAKKNARRKEKKKMHQKDQEHVGSVDRLSTALSDTSIVKTPVPNSDSSQGPDQNKADMEKKLRNLKKKLRQIEDLQSRIDSGELKEPEKEQLQKISKKKDIESEIEDLELELVDI